MPPGERWIHEIKFDGYRVQVHLRDTAVKVFTRRGHDWTHRFKKIAADAWHINAGSAIIDGEAVVLGVDGVADFNLLHSRKHDHEVQLYAFDILALDGDDLGGLPSRREET
jgi:bifunctional non-homologous end joining protein LigD